MAAFVWQLLLLGYAVHGLLIKCPKSNDPVAPSSLLQVSVDTEGKFFKDIVVKIDNQVLCGITNASGEASCTGRVHSDIGIGPILVAIGRQENNAARVLSPPVCLKRIQPSPLAALAAEVGVLELGDGDSPSPTESPFKPLLEYSAFKGTNVPAPSAKNGTIGIVQSWKLFSKEFVTDVAVPQINQRYPVVFPDASIIETMCHSSLWIPEQKFYLTIARMSSRGDRVIYCTAFNEDWTVRSEPFQVGIFAGPGAVPIPFPYLERDQNGPEDPRLFFDAEGKVRIVFNMYVPTDYRLIHTFSFEDGSVRCYKFSQLPSHNRQKNWCPFVFEKELYFMYDFELNIVLKNRSEDPLFIPSIPNTTFIGEVRGGAPFRELFNGYYFTLAFCHDLSPAAVYRPLIALIKVTKNSDGHGQARVVHTSHFLHFPDYESTRPHTRIIISSGICRVDEPKDLVWVNVYFEDVRCYVFQLSGVYKYLRNAIEEYENTGKSVVLMHSSLFK